VIENGDPSEQGALEGNQTSSGAKLILSITYNCKKNTTSF